MNFRTIPPILLMELNNMFSNIRWSIGPAFRFNTHSITENNVSRTRIASISEQKKTFRFPFWGNASSSNLHFLSHQKKKKRDYYFCRHLLSTYQSSQYDPRKSKSKYSFCTIFC
ncbi:hypothetical protein MEM_03818 [Candida albicans L26]|uniref:Uncharacterized protein n=2 Tax=Candida albicans TaxID=5476 RepID=A0A1D8PMF3_CANAL|nr:uncharacterized protein CAALFM_C405830WA [Candida albicans SC5314]KGQ88257.1 hypothetical protein MEU_03814 [Candida albicans P37005]KGR09086.1 hypothetical protein MG3_03842 [Candida albicans P78048]KGR13331.1 hypothetical protein MG9_03796 [Candida albicans P37037]KGT67775.1 hypothetical protein MEK_03825 [Candida albicans 12C]KGU07034.1 hypothetical protein MEQ_03775 [Candida albicans P87]KGU08022.1 hypothetical protein MEY_03786 [Candida albicans 19F]KGU08608.1 hypothetical protein ME|eukprot:XP_716576.2 hypothetical protein CAALFM_C405830WA [Candida albicans SC5314]